MNRLSHRIGYWSAISLTIAFIIWIISFVGIALTSSLYFWTDLSGYIEHFQTNSRFFQNLACLFMLLAGPVYVLLLNGFYNLAPEHKKVLVRISIQFALGFAVLSSLHYFVQLGPVRMNLLNGNYDGIEPFLQANPASITNSIVMLGWTLFLGLSSLFIFPVFEGGRLNKILRLAFLVNGISCVMAGVGYVIQIDALTFIFVNLVTGGAMLVISVASIRLFKREIRAVT